MILRDNNRPARGGWGWSRHKGTCRAAESDLGGSFLSSTPPPPPRLKETGRSFLFTVWMPVMQWQILQGGEVVTCLLPCAHWRWCSRGRCPQGCMLCPMLSNFTSPSMHYCSPKHHGVMGNGVLRHSIDSNSEIASHLGVLPSMPNAIRER